MMRLNAVIRVLVGGALLATSACGGATATSPATSVPGVGDGPMHSTARQSRMSPNVANADLLYISDGNGEVTVYRYWQRTLAGILTGFTQPMGECVDEHNDVYVTDYGAQQLGEYAHGGSKRLRTLPTGSYSPYACAVDFRTGNLAVAQLKSGSTQGNIAIYASASGQPTYYSVNDITKFYGLAYDSMGNLFAMGASGRYDGFAWLARYGTKLVDIKVPGPNSGRQWIGANGLQWDGKFFTVEAGGVLYQYSVFKGQAFYVGYVYLNYCCNALGPFWFYNASSGDQATQVVAAPGESSEIEYWHYPAGGNSIGSISHGIDQPMGLTISLKKK